MKIEKKRIAICIPTYNRAEILYDTCSRIMDTVSEENVDVYIYDSSENSDSENILKKFNQKGNFFYLSLPETTHSSEKLYNIYQDENIQSKYEYLWILADYLFFSKEIINTVMQKLHEKWDMLMLDFYDPEKKGSKQYYDPDQIFFEYAWSMTQFGIMIINCETVLRRADWNYLKKKYLVENHRNFSHIAMYFEMLIQIEDLKFYHFSIAWKDAYISKYKESKSTYFAEYIKVWGRYWYESIHALPDSYTRKDQVIKKACVYTRNLSKKNVLALRAQGVLNFKSFYDCRDIWEVISTVKPVFVWNIIFLPKALVRFIEEYGSIANYVAKKIRVGQLKKFCNKYDNIYIYGAGIKAEKMADFLKKQQISYEGFVVTDLKVNRKILKDHSVIEITQLENLSSLGIIIAMNEQNKQEVIPLLGEKGYCNIFLPSIV